MILQWAALGLVVVVVQQCAVAQEGEVSDAFAKTPGVYFAEDARTLRGVSLKGCEAKCAAGAEPLANSTGLCATQRHQPCKARTYCLDKRWSQMLGANPSASRGWRPRTARRTGLRSAPRVEGG